MRKQHLVQLRLGYILSILIWLGGGLQAQTLHYKAVRYNNTVGYMTVKKNCKGNDCRYDIDYQVKIKVMVEVSLGARYWAEFKNGKLVRCATKRVRDGEEKDVVETRWNGSFYVMTADGKQKTIKIPQVEYSSIMMYHHEPIGQKTNYSERVGVFMNIQAIGNHQYTVKVPGGIKHTYSFENGLCKELYTRHTFGGVRFKLDRISP